MKKERYYYAIATFMNKDGNMTVTSVYVHSTEDDPELFPLMEAIKRVEEEFSDTAIFDSIVVNSVIEITKEDYYAYQERLRKLKGEEKED